MSDEWKSYREGSRIDFGSKDYKCMDQIKLGCLLRIADATEKMALTYSFLIEDVDRYKKLYEKERARTVHCHKIMAGLRGEITKLKRGSK